MFPIEIEEVPRLRTASACLRDGVIFVRLPAHWPKKDKIEIGTRLIERVKKKNAQHARLLNSLSESTETITLDTDAALSAYVHQLNAETFRAPLTKVRIGHAKYSRLAQVNLGTGVMTVSKYCLRNVPASAIRYLILHELAHFTEASHNARFWKQVARFCPDYRQQSRLMKAFHRQAVERAEDEAFLDVMKPSPAAPPVVPVPATPPPAPKPEPAPPELTWAERFQQLRFF